MVLLQSKRRAPERGRGGARVRSLHRAGESIARNKIFYFRCADFLPADVLLTVFKYLDQRSLGRVAQVIYLHTFN